MLGAQPRRGEKERVRRGGLSDAQPGLPFGRKARPRPPAGMERLSEVTRSVRISILAPGAVTPERVPERLRPGAYGVAVLSGLMVRIGAGDRPCATSMNLTEHWLEGRFAYDHARVSLDAILET